MVDNLEKNCLGGKRRFVSWGRFPRQSSSICTNGTSTLYNDEFIVSPNRLYAAGLYNNSFGVYNTAAFGCNSTAIWSASQSSAPAGAYVIAQNDANLVIYGSTSGPVWAAGTNHGQNDAPYCLIMLDSGNLIWVEGNSTVMWQTNTVQG
ncbi:unnamed protein product [Didymodactylos carnosus]|uniref:Bulb-type lectin domain-containing protein n=1 Tax=Didymodactylos carnosus TaxID=1234261 RepID=A0A815C8G9_9BILA|nr:unnamed protein product [Didymodactylos carnosus]CAF1280475.1 unnamed protein product [Didymodactylos carnosus]CAF3973079.1 unnamed protein product [Didymodactylos carnosus]CAF4075478.1 unnamed protein product [Didymodactylos carnosus]